MFEELSPTAHIQLTEMASDLQTLIRDVMIATRAVEAEPVTRYDVERSNESDWRSLSAAERELLLTSVTQRVRDQRTSIKLIAAAVDVLETQLSSLEEDGEYLSPRNLLQTLSEALTIPTEPPGFMTLADLEAEIYDTCERFNETQTRAWNVASEKIRPDAEVQESQNLALTSMAPTDAGAHFELGDARRQQGNLTGALEAYQRAYELAPDEAHHVYFLALTLHSLGRSEEAKPHAIRATELYRSNAACWTLLGRVQEALGDPQSAVDLHLKAVALSFGDSGLESDLELQRLSANPELRMPRPDNFRTPDTDQRLTYEGFHNTAGNCRLRIFRSGADAIVLATKDAASSGTSITNFAEQLAEMICSQFNIPRDGLTWIQHYEDSISGGQILDRVEFEFTRDGRFANPRWSPLSHREFEEMTGFRLTWTKPSAM